MGVVFTFGQVFYAVPARWNGNSDLAKIFLQVRQADVKKAEWTCSECSWTNFISRSKCRHCSEPRHDARAPSSKPKESAHAANKDRDEAKAQAALLSEPRPAPEVVRAEAAAKAEALTASARALRGAGLEDKAAELEEEAAEHVKRAEKADLPLAKRLDELERWLKRAERRRDEAKDTESAAKKALDGAQAALEERETELRDGNTRLQVLRAEMRKTFEDAAVASTEDVAPTAPAKSQEFNALREQLQQALKERDAAGYAASAANSEAQQLRAANATLQQERGASQDPSSEVPSDLPTLQQELAAVQAAMDMAFKDENIEAYDDSACRHALLTTALRRALSLRRKS